MDREIVAVILPASGDEMRRCQVTETWFPGGNQLAEPRVSLNWRGDHWALAAAFPA